jgi:hypothetical protein
MTSTVMLRGSGPLNPGAYLKEIWKETIQKFVLIASDEKFQRTREGGCHIYRFRV